MTLIVGIQCTDGVVMGSDSAATLGTGVGQTIGQQSVRKIFSLSEQILYASTGSVGIAQLISHTISENWKSGYIKKDRDEEVMRLLGLKIAEIVSTYLQTGALLRQLGIDGSASLCKSLVALPVQHIPQLFSFDFGGQPEKATADIPFMAIGSGQPIADPFLAFLHRLLWKTQKPTVSEGKLIAVWTIEHVCKTNPGGVGGDVHVSTLTKQTGKGPPKLDELNADQIREHRDQIAAAEAALVNELRGSKPAAPAQKVPLPTPPPA